MASKSRIWSTDYLLSAPTSKLTKVDLQTILTDSRAWSSLTSEQQQHLAAQVSDSATEVTDGNPLPSNFGPHLRQFQEDLAEGEFKSDWQYEAQEAAKDRANGKYDEWKEKEMEVFWGQLQKLPAGSLAGESSKIKLAEMVAAGCFQVGDVWAYARTFKRDDGTKVLVEKEVILKEIDTDLALVFGVPAGRKKFPDADDTEYSLNGNPAGLGNFIVALDGRISKLPNGNAWKDYRVLRANQDMGTLFDVREAFWARQ
ncbi:hypothetical protein B0A49_01030 [Cryomyces minteri]|uniref:ASX DEUBAD domain-containing protein n=1 Tax=Cryomyces minteri TaxID=331657 RepID=A0A4U0XWE1_9PEZI|nr:hypothetical protein B0A49_01030 [Cryomyces minteri]